MHSAHSDVWLFSMHRAINQICIIPSALCPCFTLRQNGNERMISQGRIQDIGNRRDPGNG